MECICREHITRLKLHPFTSKYNISIQTNALFRCLATYMPDYLVKKKPACQEYTSNLLGFCKALIHLDLTADAKRAIFSAFRVHTPSILHTVHSIYQYIIRIYNWSSVCLHVGLDYSPVKVHM